MSSRLKNNKVAREDQKCWRIRWILYGKRMGATVQRNSFELHDAKWICNTGFYPSGWLMIKLTYKGNDSVNQFKVRAGIVERSGKEIIASEAKRESISIMTVENLIHRSQMDSILQIKKWLNFFVEIKKKSEKRVAPMTDLQMDFQELLLTGKNSDVTIKVKQKKFNCHRIILGARSPVLKAMMAKEKRCGEITITDSEPTVFQEFLLYLYSGSGEHLNTKNIIELYKLGDKYLMDDLKNQCIEQMMTNISTENFFEYFLLSQQQSDVKLTKVAIQFFFRHLKSIVGSKKWTIFLEKHPDCAKVLIATLDPNK